HLIVSGGRAWLVEAPRENRVRPAVDPLFRSAADEYRERVIGVILSGHLDDGAAGLAEIAAAGGTAIVQDPADALAAGMPSAARAHARVDHVVPARDVGKLIATIVTGSPNEATEPFPDARVSARDPA